MLGFQSIALCGAILPVLVLLIFLRVDRAIIVRSSSATGAIRGDNHTVITTLNDGRDGWTFIGTTGGIETYVKKVEGSPLLAFRGVAFLDMHISQAMGPYINITTAYDWISMLKHIQKYPVSNARLHDGEPAEDLVYQTLELPWPISPRDVLLHRKFNFDREQRTVSIHYHSVQDSRIPVVSGVIRADSPHSMWRFRSVPACSEGTPPKQGQAAPTKKNASRNWLQRKLDGIRTQSKPLDVVISVKFARNETSNSIPTKQQLLVRGATKSAEVPKQSSFSALFSQLLRRGRNQAPVVSEKVRPSGRIYTGGHQTADHQSRDSITTSTSGVTGAVSTQASMKSTKPHGGLAHLGCTDAQTLRKLSEHLPDLQTEHTGENRLRQHKNRDSKTIVEFESFVNSKGSIPAWFINHMQRSFPAQALSDYRKVASNGQTAPYAKVQEW